ncbi:hypothetical protein G9P44_004743 [Scheffersomyces stipitis]|nr:hypothetical protein G9P44_004743 [Scheffersomyces stipitis]
MGLFDRFKSEGSPKVEYDKNSESSKAVQKFSRSDIRISRIGEGISGTVDLYKSKVVPTFRYAVKTYHSKEKYESKTEYVARVLTEYNILRQLHHSNLIEVYKYEVSLSGEVRTFLEAGSPNLYDLIRSVPASSLDPKGMLCIWKQICDGVRYLHEAKVCHRDLKLNNLVVDIPNRTVKIIDFATALVVKDNEPAIGIVGSDAYIAPETIEKIRYNGMEADIWSLGIILYYLMVVKFPWKSARHSDKKYTAFKNIPDRPQSWITDHLIPPPVYTDEGLEMGKASVLRYLPAESYPLASYILMVNPTKRATIRDFWEDEWFSSIDYCHEGHRCETEHTLVFRDHLV